MDHSNCHAADRKVVSVRTIDGQGTELILPADNTVAQLKALISSKFRWASTPLLIHLMLRGSKLKDTATIQSLPLREGEFLVAIPYAKKNHRAPSNRGDWIEKGSLPPVGSACYSSNNICIKENSANVIHDECAVDRNPAETEHRTSSDGLENLSEIQGRVENRTGNTSDQCVVDHASGYLSRGTEEGGVAELWPVSNPSNMEAQLSVKHCPGRSTAILGPPAGAQNLGAAESVWQSIVADLAVAQVAAPCMPATQILGEGQAFPSQNGCRSQIRTTEGSEDGRGLQMSEEESTRKRRLHGSSSVNIGNSDMVSDSRMLRSSDDKGTSSSTWQAQSKRGKKRRKEYTAAIFRGLLPPLLEKLSSVFSALNSICGFLQKQHMQPTWNTVRVAIQPFYHHKDEQIVEDDVHILASLFPRLVVISSLCREGSDSSFNIDLLDPLKLKQQEQMNRTKAILATNFQQIGPEDVMPSGSGGKAISDRVTTTVITRRRQAFERGMVELFNTLQAQNTENFKLQDITLDDLVNAAKRLLGNAAMMATNTSALPRPPRQHKKLSRCTDVQQLPAVEMLEHLRQGIGALSQIVHCERLSPRKASYGELNVTISSCLSIALKQHGIARFYSHQAQAINAAISRNNVIIATSTASGKSLCYNVPVLEELVTDVMSCALYLFPTKALAQDQLRALQEITGGIEPAIQMGVYDGDTRLDERLKLRDNARLLITNPDMLHVGLLPSHDQFKRFFSNLRYLVVDEAHAYRGAFGCHTAIILRRLQRLCHHTYGAKPTFVICSATVANPREHAMELVGLRDILVVDDDGSPCGEKFFAFWNPPIVPTPPPPKKFLRRNNQNRGLGEVTPQMKRTSPIVEVASLLAEMVQHGLRCIAFCKTRKLCELVHNYAREILKETAPDLVSSIRAYRSGYTAEDRRAIESDLFGGKLRAVAATNALELGVDIGSLDATLHLGFPGTVASLWQQAGRAGRRERASLSIYVAFGGPLDQHFMKNPQRLFSRSIESAQLDAQNNQVLEQQLCCAAAELALHVEYDEKYFGSGLGATIMRLVKQGILGRHPKNGSAEESWYYIGEVKSPSQSVSIRAIDPDRYKIVNEATNKVIEEVEANKAFFEVYEGAVYMHQGKTFLCKVLDLAARVAICREADLKYYTKTRDYTDVHVMGGELAYPAKADSKYPTTTAQASLCKVTTHWIGFRRIWQGSCQTFDTVQLFLPDVCYESQAAWIRVPHKIRWDLEAMELSFREGLHAASHALLNVMPLYIMCNPSDLGTECANPHDTRYYPERLLVYDRHPGGIGIAAQARPMFAELLQAAWELLASCECTSNYGCPNCVQYLDCSEYNEVINKKAALVILEGVIKAENDHREGKQESSFASGAGMCKC